MTTLTEKEQKIMTEHKKVYLAYRDGDLVYGSQAFSQKESRQKAKDVIIQGIENQLTEAALENGYEIDETSFEDTKKIVESIKIKVSSYPIEEFYEIYQEYPHWGYGIFI